jgi:hypothetical protein
LFFGHVFWSFSRPFVDLSDVSPDHYLWLSGQAARVLLDENQPADALPER